MGLKYKIKELSKRNLDIKIYLRGCSKPLSPLNLLMLVERYSIKEELIKLKDKDQFLEKRKEKLKKIKEKYGNLIK